MHRHNKHLRTVSVGAERWNARLPSEWNFSIPFLTLPEMFVKDYLNSYQRVCSCNHASV